MGTPFALIRNPERHSPDLGKGEARVWVVILVVVSMGYHNYHSLVLYGIWLTLHCFLGIAIAVKTLSKKGPHPLDSFRQVIDVNIAGTFNVIRLVAEQMKDCEPVTESGERGKTLSILSSLSLSLSACM